MRLAGLAALLHMREHMEIELRIVEQLARPTGVSSEKVSATNCGLTRSSPSRSATFGSASASGCDFRIALASLQNWSSV